MVPHTNTAEGCSLIRTFLWSATQRCLSAYGGYYDLTAAAGIGSGNRSRCGDITITTGVTRVSAHSSSTSLFYCIGQGTNGTCGTVTIGGKVGYVKGRDYTYEPGN